MRRATPPPSSSCTGATRAALYRFVRRLLGAKLSAQTDEVFQDTWLRVVNARERWEPQGATFRTWLFTLAHHRVIDLLRRSGREISVDAFEGDGDEPWQPDACGVAALARPGRCRAAGRRARVLAPRRREAARLPRAAAAAAAQRLPAPSRRRPDARRGRALRSRSASRPRRRACATR
jgi:RNA polymerase sigma factor (sigma-70 family)